MNIYIYIYKEIITLTTSVPLPSDDQLGDSVSLSCMMLYTIPGA